MNKIVFDRKVLYSTLNSAKACLSDTGLTILKCFRFKYIASENAIEVTSYNNLNEMRLIIPVIDSDCNDGQEFAVDGIRLVKLLKTVRDSIVSVKIYDEEVIFSYNGSEASFFAEDVESYPDIKIGKRGTGVRVNVNRNDLYRALKRNIGFNDISDVVTSLSGVGINFICSNNCIDICSSDKIVFVRDVIECQPDISKDLCINVMPTSVKEALSFLEMLSEENVTVSVSDDERVMSISYGDFGSVFNCTLMEVKFVNYLPLVNNIKSNFNYFIKARTSDLIDSLSRIKVMSDVYNISHFVCREGDNKMDITYTNDAGYKISENVGIEGYCQGRFDCNLNIEKMINALKVFSGDYVTLAYTNPDNNAPICIINEEGDYKLMGVVNIFKSR